MTTQNLGLASETFTLLLDKIISGGPSPSLSKATCKFSYIWDYPRNMGHATLLTIDGVDVNLNMFPLGIAGCLDFMNTDLTQVRLPDGGTITLFRVILDLKAPDVRMAALMIGNQGQEVLATSNWSDSAQDTVTLSQRKVSASLAAP